MFAVAILSIMCHLSVCYPFLNSLHSPNNCTGLKLKVKWLFYSSSLYFETLTGECCDCFIFFHANIDAYFLLQGFRGIMYQYPVGNIEKIRKGRKAVKNILGEIGLEDCQNLLKVCMYNKCRVLVRCGSKACILVELTLQIRFFSNINSHVWI